MPFTDLLEIPFVKELINSSGSDTAIDVHNFEALRETIISHGSKAKREATERFESDMEKALAMHGLLPSKGHDKIRFSKSPENVLDHNCAFFRDLVQEGDPISYENTMKDGYSKVRHSYVFHSFMASLPTSNDYGYKQGIADARAMTIAKKLADVLNTGELSMKELDALGDIFVCLRCDPLLRQKLTWQELVSECCMSALVSIDKTCRRLLTFSVKKMTIKRRSCLSYGP